ncbi:hypothetical protein I4U23_022017 [Adineta vaga]|nr:hypothetical protein I4U23_022017 [Adineta vaga]
MIIPAYNVWIGLANMGKDSCPAYTNIGINLFDPDIGKNLFGSGISEFFLIWFTIWITYGFRAKGITDKITETETTTIDTVTGRVETKFKRRSLRNTLIGMSDDDSSECYNILVVMNTRF